MENYLELSNQAGKKQQTIKSEQEVGNIIFPTSFFSFVRSVIVVNVSYNEQIYRGFYSISPIKCKNV